jgi:hypothetical protein
MLLLEFDDLFRDRLRQLGRTSLGLVRGLQAGGTKLLIQVDPAAEAALGHAHLGTDIAQTEALFQPQTHGLEFGFGRIAPALFFAAPSPPRGAVVLLSLLLYYCFFIHVNTPLNIGVSTTFSLNSVS